jgi:4-alpha-glucanotransferase
MTTTHDLPTVAGWWREHDIVLQDRLGWLPGLAELARSERAADRERLWAAFRRAKCANGSMPTPDEPDLAIAGALRFIGNSRCSLAIASIEDIAGEREQPNMPGTIGEHPNWRRRMNQRNPMRGKAARARLEAFVSARNRE